MKACRLLSSGRSGSNETLHVDVDSAAAKKKHGRSSLSDSNPFSVNYRPQRMSDSFTVALRHTTQPKKPAARTLTNSDPKVGSVARRKIIINKNPENFTPPSYKTQKITQFFGKKSHQDQSTSKLEVEHRSSIEENCPPRNVEMFDNVIAATGQYVVTNIPSKLVENITGMSPSYKRKEASVWRETCAEINDDQLISPSIVRATPPISRKKNRRISNKQSEFRPATHAVQNTVTDATQCSPSFIISPCVNDKRKRRSRRLSEKMKPGSPPKIRKPATIGISTDVFEKSSSRTLSVSPSAMRRLVGNVPEEMSPTKNSVIFSSGVSPKIGLIANRISGKRTKSPPVNATSIQGTQNSPCIASTPPKKRRRPSRQDRLHPHQKQNSADATAFLNSTEMSPVVNKEMPTRSQRQMTTPVRIGIDALFSSGMSPVVTNKALPYITRVSPRANIISNFIKSQSASKSPIIPRDSSLSPGIATSRRSSVGPYKRIPRRKLLLDDEGSENPRVEKGYQSGNSRPSGSSTPDIGQIFPGNNAVRRDMSNIGNKTSPVICKENNCGFDSILRNIDVSPPISTKMPLLDHNQSIVDSVTKKLFIEQETNLSTKLARFPGESQDCIPSSVVSYDSSKSARRRMRKIRRSKCDPKTLVQNETEASNSVGKNVEMPGVAAHTGSTVPVQSNLSIQRNDLLDNLVQSPPINSSFRGNRLPAPSDDLVNFLGNLLPSPPICTLRREAWREQSQYFQNSRENVLMDSTPSSPVVTPEKGCRVKGHDLWNCPQSPPVLQSPLLPKNHSQPTSVNNSRTFASQTKHFLENFPQSPVIADASSLVRTPSPNLLEDCPPSPIIEASPKHSNPVPEASKCITFQEPIIKQSSFKVDDFYMQQSQQVLVNTDDIFSKKQLHCTMRAAGTQAIDEFDTEKLHLVSQVTKGEGWSSEGKISEIMSDGRYCRSKSEGDTPKTVIETLAQAKKRKYGARSSLLAELQEARKGFASERRTREYERGKGEPVGGKDFYVVDAWGKVPLRVSAVSEEGPALLVISKGLLKTSNSIYPGCRIRIYPPWDVEEGCADEPPVYTSIRTCDVSLGPPVAGAEKWREVDVQTYCHDPRKLIAELVSA